MENLLSNDEIVMKKDNHKLDNLLDDLQRIILARKEFPTALEQVQFELAFTDNIQTLLVHSNENWMKNLNLHLTME
jgi:hypothetical protein